MNGKTSIVHGEKGERMPRLIDADALIGDVTERYCKDCNRRKGIKNGVIKTLYEIGEVPCRACSLDDMKDTLENAPTIDAEPVRHGHWIFSQDDAKGTCSCCQYPIYGKPYNGQYLITPYNYCPNCGAKMDEVE